MKKLETRGNAKLLVKLKIGTTTLAYFKR